jgi:hypothetical protein
MHDQVVLVRKTYDAAKVNRDWYDFQIPLRIVAANLGKHKNFQEFFFQTVIKIILKNTSARCDRQRPFPYKGQTQTKSSSDD